jgi:alcohol dehydrogenase/L-iditol 2-dehydrogenase
LKAIVKYDLADRAIEVRDIPEPELLPGHVLISLKAVGVCGSDVHMWRNSQSWEVKLPLVLGHESAGVISAVASDVTGWNVGDRVVCETAAKICGTCALCRTGRYNLCPDREGYGAIRDGAFSELLLAEPRALHKIPDNVPFEQACMTEPFAVAYTAIVERTDIRPGDVVVIQGAGTIGQLAAQMARLRGAGTIVMLGVTLDKARLEKAKELGVDYTLDVSIDDATAFIQTLGDGLGAHVVIDATGVSSALKQALDLVRPFGTIVKVGWGPQPLGFSLDPLVAKAITLVGSFSHTWSTWEAVLSMFATGRLETQKVLGGLYQLDDWEEAFEAMEQGHNIKSVIVFN